MERKRIDRSSAALVLALTLVVAGAVFSGCARVPTTEMNVAFTGSHGQNISLKLRCSNNCSTSLKGKVVLVNFWATWCDPCRAEIPSLIQFQEKYGGKGFTLLGIAMDEDGAGVVQRFVDKTKFDVDGYPKTMNYPIVIGSDPVADKFGGLWAYPTSFVIGRDGKIAKRIIGGVTPSDLNDIRAMIGT
jgi:thiol-disulfide isomerase/thioredoxin